MQFGARSPIAAVAVAEARSVAPAFPAAPLLEKFKR